MNRPPPQKCCNGAPMTVKADGSEECAACGCRIVFDTEVKKAIVYEHGPRTGCGFLILPQGWGVKYMPTAADLATQTVSR